MGSLAPVYIYDSEQFAPIGSLSSEVTLHTKFKQQLIILDEIIDGQKKVSVDEIDNFVKNVDALLCDKKFKDIELNVASEILSDLSDKSLRLFKKTEIVEQKLANYRLKQKLMLRSCLYLGGLIAGHFIPGRDCYIYHQDETRELIYTDSDNHVTIGMLCGFGVACYKIGYSMFTRPKITLGELTIESIESIVMDECTTPFFVAFGGGFKFNSVGSCILSAILGKFSYDFYSYFKADRNLKSIAELHDRCHKLSVQIDDLSKDDDVCCVCLSKGLNCQLKACKHKYHKTCITTWLEQKKTCPYCNQKATKDSIISLYSESGQLQCDFIKS